MNLILCYPCKEMRAPVEMVGDECYICVLKRGIPSGYFGRCVYRKAVAIALALATPLTLKQARRVVRIAGLGNMELLNRMQGWTVKPINPEHRSGFYSMAVDAAKEVRG